MKKIYSLQRLFCALMFFSSSAAFCQPGFQGPNNPQTVLQSPSDACLSCTGSIWTNANDVKVADGVNASAGFSPNGNCLQSTCYYSRALLATNFGFTVPLTAIITGIKAEALRNCSSDSISDRAVELYLGGVRGSNKMNTASWPASPAYAVYGDSTDLWGTTWTPGEIDSSSFGLFYQVQNDAMMFKSTKAFVDHIRITVYYSDATGVISHQTSDEPGGYYNSSEQSLIVRNAAGNASFHQLVVIDILGKQVLKKTLGGSTRDTTNLAELPPGIYFFRLIGNDGKEAAVRRFVK